MLLWDNSQFSTSKTLLHYTISTVRIENEVSLAGGVIQRLSIESQPLAPTSTENRSEAARSASMLPSEAPTLRAFGVLKSSIGTAFVSSMCCFSSVFQHPQSDAGTQTTGMGKVRSRGFFSHMGSYISVKSSLHQKTDLETSSRLWTLPYVRSRVGRHPTCGVVMWIVN